MMASLPCDIYDARREYQDVLRKSQACGTQIPVIEVIVCVSMLVHQPCPENIG